MTVKDYIFYKTSCIEKILKYKLCWVADTSEKVPDLNCDVQDLLLEVVDLNQGAGSENRWDPPPEKKYILTPVYSCISPR